MDIRYNVAELFKIAFGVNSPVFIPFPLSKTPPAVIDFSGIETKKKDEGWYDFEIKSHLGTPVIFAAILEGGKYKVYEKGKIVEKQFENTMFPYATLFSFRRAKNIIRTNVLGSDGTVKEIFGFDDWVIDVKGLCLDTPEKTAREQLKELLAFKQIADAIEIEGALFEALNITRVCITDWQSEVPQGKEGVIAFQCSMISDGDLEFQLKV